MNKTRRMFAPLGFLAILSLLRTGVVAGQQSAADSAWALGDFASARRNYEQVLVNDPNSVRANYRLGILASWDSRFDSALVLIHRARAVEPDDPDLHLQEALILAWADRFDQAIIHYDSVIAAHPSRTDALMGRAQTLAWANRFHEADAAYESIIARDPGNLDAATGRAQLAAWRGDLPAAIRQYETILAKDPRHVAALAGLGQVNLWQGHVVAAEGFARRAHETSPGDRAVRDLDVALRTATRPQPELTLGWSNDSDHNTAWWQTVAASIFVADGFRAFGSAGALEVSDPVRNASRLSAEAGLSYGIGNLGITGALGIRHLSPDSGSGYAAGTFRVSSSYRLSSRAGVGVAFAHYSFDETALLIDQHLRIDALDLSANLLLRPGLSVEGGAGQVWLSDHNSRVSGIVAVTQTIRRNFWAGAMARGLSYEFKGIGYFSPDRFTLFEARGGWSRAWHPWHARVSGGLGVQQGARGTRSQAEWHLEGRVGRNWTPFSAVEFFAGISTSAESSTTGAFRYRTAGIVIRVGL
ncbi:MAG: tetratricopeptide repeat protein [Gemmatimonadota bacterium]